MDAKLSLLHTVQVPGVEMTWADQRSLEKQHVWCAHRCLLWCTCSAWGFRMQTGHLSVSPCSIWIGSPRRVKGIERFLHWELFYFSLCLQSCMKTLSMTLCFLMIFFMLFFTFSLYPGSSPTVDLPDGWSRSCPTPLQSFLAPLRRDLHSYEGPAQDSWGRVGSWLWEKCKLIESIHEFSTVGN